MSGRLVVFRTSRPGVGAVLVRMVIGLVRLLPGLIGLLLPGLHILFVDLTHGLPFTMPFCGAVVRLAFLVAPWCAVRVRMISGARRRPSPHSRFGEEPP